ncbi:MAG: TetR/AcrR family transcriptional regulator [bacterium]|nr:MAG: TetR/AcrR family transcriptional regulator [bacterium]
MKEIEKRARKQALLDAAHDLFARVGYDGTTIEAIAQRAGMAKGSFYLHFSSQEEIFRALIDEIGDRIIVEMQMTAASENSLEEKLTGLGEGILRFHLDSSHPWMFILMEKGIDRHEVMEHFFVKRKKVMDIINGVLVESIESGEIVREEPDRLSSLFLGCINGTVVRGCCMGEELEPREEAAWLAKRFLEGVLLPGGNR